MKTAGDIIKGKPLYFVESGSSVLDAAKLMAEKKISVRFLCFQKMGNFSAFSPNGIY
ncbi:hypothetical protein JGI12_01225 [Candidatus Kryptonium thompsonii]|nr:hypothetical protein JGI12_01225 [Candidatus Kryptonium thompsoni]